MTFKVSARINGIKESIVVDAFDKDDAAEYGYSKWCVDDVWVEEVKE